MDWRRILMVVATLALGCGSEEEFDLYRPGGHEAGLPDVPEPADAGSEAGFDASRDAPYCEFDPEAPEPPGADDPGPVHYWTFDDETTPGMTVDVVSSVPGAEIGTPSKAKGPVGSAYAFDGVSYLRFGDVLDVLGASFSVHFWYRNRATDSAQRAILCKGGTGSGSPPLRGYLVRLRDGLVEWAVNDSGSSIIAMAQEPERGVWHHVVGVLDRRRCSVLVYVDGVLAASQPYRRLESIQTNVRFSIAAVDRNPGSPLVNQHMIGDLDDVAVFLRALDAAEVQALHLRGLAGQSLLP